MWRGSMIRAVASDDVPAANELALHPLRLPSSIASLVEGSDVERVDIGESSAQVFQLTMPDRRLLFLKQAPPDAGLSLEAERLRWLRGKAPVPDVVAFALEDSGEYLLMT